MYGRRIRVEARKGPDGPTFFETDELRISFESDVEFTMGLAKTKVSIYNLSKENSAKLLYVDQEPARLVNGKPRVTEKIYIRVYAGYDDELDRSGGDLPLLLDGFVMNGTFIRKRPENITHLYVTPLSSGYLNLEFTPFNTKGMGGINAPSLNLKQTLKQMCLDVGYLEEGLDFTYLPTPDKILQAEQISPDVDRGIQGAFDTMQRDHHFEVIPTTSGLSFYPRMDDTEEGRAFHDLFISDATGTHRLVVKPNLMKGTPVVGSMDIQVPYVLSPELFPGYVIDVTEILGATEENQKFPANGLADYTGVARQLHRIDDFSSYAVFKYYRINRVVHKADNYKDLWETTLVCKMPSTGNTGIDHTFKR